MLIGQETLKLARKKLKQKNKARNKVIPKMLNMLRPHGPNRFARYEKHKRKKQTFTNYSKTI